MVVLTIHLDEFSTEVGAHRGENGAGIVEHGFGEHAAAVLGLRARLTTASMADSSK